jgi:Na+/serine symporter
MHASSEQLSTSRTKARQVQVRDSLCIWWDGSQHCHGYITLAAINLTCASLDFAAAVLLSLFGHVMATGSSALRTCALVALPWTGYCMATWLRVSDAIGWQEEVDT